MKDKQNMGNEFNEDIVQDGVDPSLEPSEKDYLKTLKKVLSAVLTVLISLYTVFALTISILIFSSMGTGQPSLFGYTFMNVLTDSMEDEFYPGDVVLCEQLDDYTDLEDGEVIAYRITITDDQGNSEEIIRIHRIVKRDETGINYITKGDNSPAVDEYRVSPSYIIGVYNGTRIPVLGSIISFVTSQTGILICLVIPMALFFIYALYKFIKAILEYKMSKAPAGGLSEEQKQAAIAEYLAKQAQEKENENAPPAEDNGENK